MGADTNAPSSSSSSSHQHHFRRAYRPKDIPPPPPPPPMPPPLMMMRRREPNTNRDSFSVYRRLCEARMRRLERYKKAKSLCALDTADPSTASSTEDSSLVNRRPDCHKSTSHLAAHPSSSSSPMEDDHLRMKAAFSHSDLLGPCSPTPSSFILLGGDSMVVDSEGMMAPPVFGIPRPGKGASSSDGYSHSSTASSSSGGGGGEGVATATAAAAPKADEGVQGQFEMLKDQLISLMENDVHLLQKLLTLGETIQTLRRGEQPPAISSPATAVDQQHPESDGDGDSEEMSDERRPLPQRQAIFSHSKSAVTTLYVEEQEEKLRPNVQYFSRKNSVLRIPIRPRASNRAVAGRMSRRLCAPPPPHAHLKNALPSEEDSGHSSASSDSPPAQLSPPAPIETAALLFAPPPPSDSGQSSTAASTVGSSRYSTFSSTSSKSSGILNYCPEEEEGDAGGVDSFNEKNNAFRQRSQISAVEESPIQ